MWSWPGRHTGVAFWRPVCSASTHRRLGVNHLVMSTDWAGTPESLAAETIEMLAKEAFPRVRQGL